MASFTNLLHQNTTTITTSQYQQPPPPPSNHPSNSDFPIAIAILAIIALAIILISYYIFVIKCCLNWQTLDPLRRFSISRQAHRNPETSLTSFSPMVDTIHHRGLDEFLLNNIPSLQYKPSQGSSNTYTAALGSEISTSFRGCAICLCAFQEKEMLRFLPRCKHTYHLDCIDVWLLNNASCPLCRSNISGRTKYPFNQIIAPSSSPQELISPLFSGNLSMISLNGDDQDYLVLEISEDQEQRKRESIFCKNLHNFSIMGDECINIRQKDEEFNVKQPIRRSFSLDSAADHGLILQVQEIVRKNQRGLCGNYNEISGNSSVNEEINNGVNGRISRSLFFSFGHGCRSRSSLVLPIECDG